MEVRWSLPAAEDLERIFERIEHDNRNSQKELPAEHTAEYLLTRWKSAGVQGTRVCAAKVFLAIAAPDVRFHPAQEAVSSVDEYET